MVHLKLKFPNRKLKLKQKVESCKLIKDAIFAELFLTWKQNI